MPFDPKLIRPEEPPLTADGELQLPDGLQALASQLTDDALHLAACFPAASYPAGRDPAQCCEALVPANRSSRLLRWTSAALASAAVGGTALAVMLGVFATGWRLSRPHLAAPGATTARASAAPQLPVATNAVADRPAPTVSLVSLSGPELEALVDLLERDRAPVASVSF